MLVIVGGPPAAGKSFLASKLSSCLGARHIEADRIIRNCNHKDVTYKEERRGLLNIVNELLKDGERVILDDCMHLKSMRKPFRKLCCELSVPYGIIWIDIENVEILLARDAKRKYPVGPETIIKIFREIETPLKEVFLMTVGSFSEPDVIEFCTNLKIPDIKLLQPLEFHQGVSSKHELNIALCKVAHYYITQYELEPKKCSIVKKALLSRLTYIIPDEDLKQLFLEVYNCNEKVALEGQL